MVKIDVLFVQYTNPGAYPPLINGSHLLAEAGQRVLFAGVGGGGLDAMTVPRHPRIKVRLLPWARPGWRQKLHYLRFTAWVIGLALSHRPRWIYASDVLACIPALALKLLGFRILYHEHDHPGAPRTRFMRAAMAARRWLARRSPCVVPNAQRGELFRQETSPLSLAIVWNCPRRIEVRNAREDHRDGITIFYVGVVGPTMLPPNIVAGLVATPPTVRLLVVGYEVIGHEGYTDHLRYACTHMGVSKRVEFLGPKSREQFYAIAISCDVGLVTLPMDSPNVNIRHLLGASNKAFDYLACGLALLVSDKAEWRALVEDGPLGLSCNPADPTSIAAALRWFHDHPAETRAMGERGRQRILSEWNYDTQFAPIMKILQAPLVRRTA